MEINIKNIIKAKPNITISELNNLIKEKRSRNNVENAISKFARGEC